MDPCMFYLYMCTLICIVNETRQIVHLGTFNNTWHVWHPLAYSPMGDCVPPPRRDSLRLCVCACSRTVNTICDFRDWLCMYVCVGIWSPPTHVSFWSLRNWEKMTLKIFVNMHISTNRRKKRFSWNFKMAAKMAAKGLRWRIYVGRNTNYPLK